MKVLRLGLLIFFLFFFLTISTHATEIIRPYFSLHCHVDKGEVAEEFCRFDWCQPKADDLNKVSEMEISVFGGREGVSVGRDAAYVDFWGYNNSEESLLPLQRVCQEDISPVIMAAKHANANFTQECAFFKDSKKISDYSSVQKFDNWYLGCRPYRYRGSFPFGLLNLLPLAIILLVAIFVLIKFILRSQKPKKK